MTPRLKKFLVLIAAFVFGYIIFSLLMTFAIPQTNQYITKSFGVYFFLSFIYLIISAGAAIVCYLFLKKKFLLKGTETGDFTQVPGINPVIIKPRWRLSTYKISLILTVLYIGLLWIPGSFTAPSIQFVINVVWSLLIFSYLVSFISAIRDHKWWLLVLFCILLLVIILGVAYLSLIIQSL